MSKKKDEQTYVRVRDGAGEEFLCPLDALKPSEEATEEELTNCVDQATAGRHPSNIETKGES
jgi:hypothetical protein